MCVPAGSLSVSIGKVSAVVVSQAAPARDEQEVACGGRQHPPQRRSGPGSGPARVRRSTGPARRAPAWSSTRSRTSPCLTTSRCRQDSCTGSTTPTRRGRARRDSRAITSSPGGRTSSRTASVRTRPGRERSAPRTRRCACCPDCTLTRCCSCPSRGRGSRCCSCRSRPAATCRVGRSSNGWDSRWSTWWSTRSASASTSRRRSSAATAHRSTSCSSTAARGWSSRTSRRWRSSSATSVFDASQYLVNVIVGDHPNPFDYGFDLVVSSVHKNFPGPQKALLATRVPTTSGGCSCRACRRTSRTCTSAAPTPPR